MLSLEPEGELAAFSAAAVIECASWHCLPPQHTAFLLSARSLGGWELPEGGGLLLKPLWLEACSVFRQEGCIFSFTRLHIYQPRDLLWQHRFQSLCCVFVLSWKREVRKVWRAAERGISPTLEQWLSSQSVACWRRSDSSDAVADLGRTCCSNSTWVSSQAAKLWSCQHWSSRLLQLASPGAEDKSGCAVSCALILCGISWFLQRKLVMDGWQVTRTGCPGKCRDGQFWENHEGGFQETKPGAREGCS